MKRLANHSYYICRIVAKLNMLMKKYIIISMSLMCFVPTLAQEEYESLLSESKVWTMRYKSVYNPEGSGDVYNFVDTKLVGDTIINGVHFKQKYRRDWRNDKEIPTEWSATGEYLGQEGGKVYQYYDKTKRMVLDMVMSLQVGDRTACLYNEDIPLYFIATAASDTTLNNTDEIKPRRCVHVQLEYHSTTDVWIEGIGSVTIGINGLGYYLSSGAIPKLYRCTDGDAVIYQSDSTLDIQDVRLYRSEDNGTIYDLQGRRLTDKPTKGLYIQNGKKVIVK